MLLNEWDYLLSSIKDFIVGRMAADAMEEVTEAMNIKVTNF